MFRVAQGDQAVQDLQIQLTKYEHGKAAGDAEKEAAEKRCVVRDSNSGH